MEFTKHKHFLLKNHPEYKESWVQNIIAEDPSILGLGELILKDKERQQPRAGRLDLLLQNAETKRRYEVELQLGATDEAHIIRTIEYWDIERKRYPQYDHCAVIIAENITSRFLNVISLFNGTIPVIAIQMSAIQVGGQFSLVFTKVLDEFELGLVDDDEDELIVQTDRSYWEKRSTKVTVALADEILVWLGELEEGLSLNYNKHYIGLFRNGHPFNFISFRPRRTRINVEIKLPREDELDAAIEDAGLETLEYNSKWQRYQLSLEKDDLDANKETLMRLFRRAYERRK